MLPLFPVSHAARLRGGLSLVVALVTAAAFTVSCQKVPLLAPSGSTITLTAATNALPVGGTTQLVAQIIEPSGTPPHAGTQITFTTTLGTIQPDQVETDASGRAVATFSAGGVNGTATITAISGGSSASGNSAIKIALGTAAAGRVNVSANPTQLPALGGNSTITASVIDINGNVLPNAPVTFSTSAGTLTQSLVSTNASGAALTVLSTSTQAVVTATVGATGTGGATGATGGTGSTTPTAGPTSGTVTVSLLGAPSLTITQPTSAPQSGLPASFTFAVTAATTNGSQVTNLAINWGDGTPTENKGAITGSSVQSHTYRAAATYIISATVTDAAGNSISQSVSVTVVPLAPPTIVITQSPLPGHVGAQTNITIQVTIPTGLALTHETIDFGDGTTADLGGGSTNITIPHQYNSTGTFNVTVNVTDTSGTTTQGRGSVQITT